MNMQGYIDEIKLELTGGVLELEIPDSVISQAVENCMREIQRYMSSTKIITIPYNPCIDLKDYKINSIANVYRAINAGDVGDGKISFDPMQLSFYQLASGGNMYNFDDYVSRFASWNTLKQIRNTTSTDLAYFYQADEKKLYINATLDTGANITIEYIPRYDTVDEIVSDYWIDILMRMSKALVKTILGRIRGRFVQSNALWTQDAQQMLESGTQELTELREHLKNNTQLLYPKD